MERKVRLVGLQADGLLLQLGQRHRPAASAAGCDCSAVGEKFLRRSGRNEQDGQPDNLDGNFFS